MAKLLNRQRQEIALGLNRHSCPKLPEDLLFGFTRYNCIVPFRSSKKLILNEVRANQRLGLEADEGFESLPLRHFPPL
jgi:hypothetical protein